jgi:NADH:ubiquinone oxidoreductase subunit E
VAIKLAQAQSELSQFSQEDLSRIDGIINRNYGKPGALIPVLEEVQSTLGYLPVSIQLRVAKGLNIPPSNVYGVVTFYSFFTMVPKGRHGIRVCFGTACYVKGAQRIFEKLSSHLGIGRGGCTDDRRFSLETVRCLGVCGLAPVMVIDEDPHGQLKASEVEKKLTPYE